MLCINCAKPLKGWSLFYYGNQIKCMSCGSLYSPAWRQSGGFIISLILALNLLAQKNSYQRWVALIFLVGWAYLVWRDYQDYSHLLEPKYKFVEKQEPPTALEKSDLHIFLGVVLAVIASLLVGWWLVF
jgi:hypothetical protein